MVLLVVLLFFLIWHSVMMALLIGFFLRIVVWSMLPCCIICSLMHLKKFVMFVKKSKAMLPISKTINVKTFWSAVGGIAGGLVNGFFNHMINGQNNVAMSQMNRANIEAQTDINERNIQAQQEQNAYNSPAAQLSRMQAAGINTSFMGESAVSPGNQSGLPTLVAPVSQAYMATSPDVGGPLAQGFIAEANAEVLKADARQKNSQAAAIEFQLSIDKKFKEPQMQKLFRKMDQDWLKGNEEINLIKSQILSADEDVKRKTIENRYLEAEKDVYLKQLVANLSLTEAQTQELVQKAALDMAQASECNVRTAYQLIINRLREEYPNVFLSSVAGDGIAGAVGFVLDMLGFDKDEVRQAIKDFIGRKDEREERREERREKRAQKRAERAKRAPDVLPIMLR